MLFKTTQKKIKIDNIKNPIANISVLLIQVQICCVFQPVNGCSARHSLVEIICFFVKKSFLSFFVTKGKKEEKRKKSAKRRLAMVLERAGHQVFNLHLNNIFLCFYC